MLAVHSLLHLLTALVIASAQVDPQSVVYARQQFWLGVSDIRHCETRAKAGDGQVVLISGEAGLGKSRITAALAERLYAEPHLRLRYFCSPYHQDSALFPFIDQLGRASGFAR